MLPSLRGRTSQRLDLYPSVFHTPKAQLEHNVSHTLFRCSRSGRAGPSCVRLTCKHQKAGAGNAAQRLRACSLRRRNSPHSPATHITMDVQYICTQTSLRQPERLFTIDTRRNQFRLGSDESGSATNPSSQKAFLLVPHREQALPPDR